MTSRQYQNLVKQSFASNGNEIKEILSKYDYGVQFIASNEKKRVAVYVRFLNAQDKLTYQTVMLLYAGSKYYECSGAALVVNRKVDDAVKEVAQKLGVRIYEEWMPRA